LACQDEFFVNNPLDVEENYEHALVLLITCLVSFGLGEFELSITTYAFFLERLSNHCQGLLDTFSEMCTKFDAVPLSDPFQNHIRPDT
jgi:hypothetical protein